MGDQKVDLDTMKAFRSWFTEKMLREAPPPKTKKMPKKHKYRRKPKHPKGVEICDD